MRKALLPFLLLIPFAGNLFAHCDTLNGPVVAAARLALERGDLTPVLRWVSAGAEAEVRDAFVRARTVRAESEAARALADRWFFETVVRLHRAGEGMPFTGLKSDPPAEAVARADAAILSGSVDALASDLARTVADAVRVRFERLMQARRTADQNVESGRRYVEAYIDFTHAIERLHDGEHGLEEH